MAYARNPENNDHVKLTRATERTYACEASDLGIAPGKRPPAMIYLEMPGGYALACDFHDRQSTNEVFRYYARNGVDLVAVYND